MISEAERIAADPARRARFLEILNKRERSIRRISEACADLYATKKAKGPDVVWSSKLGPCTAWERDLARQLVAQQITYDAAMGAWFTPEVRDGE